MQKLSLSAAAVLLALPFATSVAVSGAMAAGSETPKCKAGEAYDEKTKSCKVASLEEQQDEGVYSKGRELALAGHYNEAIEVLSTAHDKNDARILNYLGYSHRKLGRVSVGLGYYREAILADPTYVQVREYLGEAHLQMGNVAAAKEQLGVIERLCGKGCNEYSALAKEIAKAG